jgi:hypothetical protein
MISDQPIGEISDGAAATIHNLYAIMLMESLPAAMIGKAQFLAADVNFRFSVSVVEDRKQATDLIDKALSKNPGRALAHSVKGDILIFGHPEGHWLNTTLRLNAIQICKMPTLARQLHLCRPGERAKLCPRFS